MEMPRLSVLKLVSSRRTLKKWSGKHILEIFTIISYTLQNIFEDGICMH